MSSDSYNGDGVQNNFTITYDYLDRDFIQVYVDSVLQTEGVNYSFLSDTVVSFLIGGTPPPVGTNNVELRRVTSLTPIVDFSNGASLTEDDLDKAFTQPIHIAEEAVRDSIAGITLTGSHWDADSRRITNVAPPVVGTDVATNDSIASQVSAAEAAETGAQTAESGAQTAETNAGNAAVAAVAARDQAITAQTAAEAAETAAEAARDEITGVIPTSGLTAYNIMRVNNAGSAFQESSAEINLITSRDSSLVGDSEDIVTLPNNGLDHFVIELRNFAPSDVSAILKLQFSIDGASTWENGASDYEWSLYDVAPGAARSAQSTGDTGVDLCRNLSNSRNSSYLRIDVFVGNGSDNHNSVLWRGVVNDAAGPANIHGAATFVGSFTRATDLRLFWEAGETFDDGERLLMGRTGY